MAASWMAMVLSARLAMTRVLPSGVGRARTGSRPVFAEPRMARVRQSMATMVLLPDEVT